MYPTIYVRQYENCHHCICDNFRLYILMLCGCRANKQTYFVPNMEIIFNKSARKSHAEDTAKDYKRMYFEQLDKTIECYTEWTGARMFIAEMGLIKEYKKFMKSYKERTGY
ncbi:hypothetical protein [Phocaeicola vulgatus]|nr:hypothetical protein [Phocaeicola vulgatus]MCB6291426.1 hypothetical protein [Phocaeicola vulgatus]MCB6504577.1 hypothetical protein [Phocaeicola vulgatus]MCQ4899056.1 hypothetical protein [Phocaeicola vulgatus]MCQ5266579.1 hypothetical protein [Phocaeicola vulgatus]MCQ5317759.1 hypothetical protein [Phocaeicola vulgatus]